MMISPAALVLSTVAFLPCCWATLIGTSNARSLYERTTSTNKAGLAWPNKYFDDMSQYAFTGKVSWYYTWTPESYSSGANLEFVPMLWGSKQVDDWSSINQTIHYSNVSHVLGFNEPENPGQSNMTAQEGADLWRQYIEPLKTSQGIRLGTPAPDGDAAGKVWLQDWLRLCDGGCNPDFMALHWYGTDADAFIAYLNEYHDTFKLNVWVTEWACQNFVDKSKQCSADDIVDFMNKTQSYMDETDWVERYSWFGAMTTLPDGVNEDDAIMDKHGKINNLGLQYISTNGTLPVPPKAGLSFRANPSLLLPTAFSILIYSVLVW